jgi:hypothetical protein
VLKRYSHAESGGWRCETADQSQFASRSVYGNRLAEIAPMLRTAFYLDWVSLEAGRRP